MERTQPINLRKPSKRIKFIRLTTRPMMILCSFGCGRVATHTGGYKDYPIDINTLIGCELCVRRWYKISRPRKIRFKHSLKL